MDIPASQIQEQVVGKVTTGARAVSCKDHTVGMPVRANMASPIAQFRILNTTR